MNKITAKLGAAAAIALVLSGPGFAQDNFYDGKQIRIVVSFGPGGGYDIFSRLVARHMGKHIPGEPSVIVENKPGAGGIAAANALYNTERGDGTVIGTIPPNVILAEALGTDVSYDSLRFKYLGSGADDFIACIVRTDAAAQTVEEAQKTAIPIASQSPGSLSFAIPMLLNSAAGLQFNVVAGYASIPDQFLAMQKNEASGTCQAYTSVLLATQRPLLEGDDPQARIMVAVTTEKVDGEFLDDVPIAMSYATSEDGKAALRAVELLGMSYPFAVGPEVPEDRVEILRNALAATFADPAFLEDAATAGQVITARTGEEVAGVAGEIMGLPESVKETLKPLLLRQ